MCAFIASSPLLPIASVVLIAAAMLAALRAAYFLALGWGDRETSLEVKKRLLFHVLPMAGAAFLLASAPATFCG